MESIRETPITKISFRRATSLSSVHTAGPRGLHRRDAEHHSWFLPYRCEGRRPSPPYGALFSPSSGPSRSRSLHRIHRCTRCGRRQERRRRKEDRPTPRDLSSPATLSYLFLADDNGNCHTSAPRASSTQTN
jgi:hypothetical protein